MRTLYPLLVIYIALIASGCTTTHNTSGAPHEETFPRCHHHKDPVSVTFLNAHTFSRPYKVLGEATVSRYNPAGAKRQEATIRDLMRQEAASLDGDGIINIHRGDDKITATVIRYKKVMV